MRRAVERGEIAAGLDLELLLDHVPIDEAAGQRLAALVVRAAKPG